MKKMMVLSAVAFSVCSVAFGTSAMAANTAITTSATTVLGGVTFKPSTLVTLVVTADDTTYTVSGKHTNGDKIYYTTQASPDITAKDSTKGHVITTAAEGAPD